MESQGENSGSSHHRRRQRVVLLPMPFQGHINPMLQLAHVLYSKGFSITILHTRFNSSYTSNYPHFTFKLLNGSNVVDKLSSKGLHDLISGVIQSNQCGADSLHEQLAAMLMASKQEEEPIACLITDALWYYTQSVADGLKLPRMVLRTSSMFCLLVFASIPVLDGQGYLDKVYSVFDEVGTDIDVEKRLAPEEGNIFLDLERRVPEFPSFKVKDIRKMRIKGQQDPTAELLANMVKATKACSGIIWNSFKELEEPELRKILQEFPIPSFPIGPFHKHFSASSSSLLEQDRSFMSWLDRQPPKSVLYISFGSAAQLDQKDLLEMAHGLAMSQQPFLWVARPGFVKGSECERVPDGLLERGRVVKWAPQQEVLAHEATGAFWTHGGWNSTLESVCEGVPMICSPFWGDQPLDARYVSDVWKVGVYLEDGWEREEIASAIRRVMVDEEGEGIRERARSLKEKASICLTKGCSSYESLESLVHYISSLFSLIDHDIICHI